LQKTFSVTDETEFYLLLKLIMLIIRVLAIIFAINKYNKVIATSSFVDLISMNPGAFSWYPLP
jgi:uncharacterized MnhB-related membrane protein